MIYTKFEQRKFGAKKCKLRFNKGQRWYIPRLPLNLQPHVNCQGNKVFTIFAFDFPPSLHFFAPYFYPVNLCKSNFSCSASLRPGTKGFTCGKWIIAYNFGTDDGAELKFCAHKELIFFNILKYKYCVNKSREMSVTILLKIVNYWPIGGWFKKRNRAITFFYFKLNISNTSRLDSDHPLLFIEKLWGKTSFKHPNLILNYLKLQF